MVGRTVSICTLVSICLLFQAGAAGAKPVILERDEYYVGNDVVTPPGEWPGPHSYAQISADGRTLRNTTELSSGGPDDTATMDVNRYFRFKATDPKLRVSFDYVATVNATATSYDYVHGSSVGCNAIIRMMIPDLTSFEVWPEISLFPNPPQALPVSDSISIPDHYEQDFDLVVGHTYDWCQLEVWTACTGSNCDYSTSSLAQITNFNIEYASVPIPVPAAVWMLGSGLIGLISLGKRKN